VDNFAREIRSDVAATSGYPDLSVYVNFANGDETPEQIYSLDNLSRLRALKETWDPNNVFRYYNSFV
jgi:hypothetical protein